MMERSFTIGISGLPHSGKTTLAKTLARDIALLHAVDVHILSQDDFFLDIATAPLLSASIHTAGLPAPDYPHARRWRELCHPDRVSPDFWGIVQTMVQGEEHPRATVIRKADGKTAPYDRVVIVEGSFLFHDDSPLQNEGLFDLQVFLQPTLKWALQHRAWNMDLPPHYSTTRCYVERVAWPNVLRAHGRLLAGQIPGVRVLKENRAVDPTLRWARDLAQEGMDEKEKIGARTS